MTLVLIASLGIQMAFVFMGNFAPPAYPEWIQKTLSGVIAGVTLLCTFLKTSIYPVELRVNPWILAAGLVGLAATSPIAGLIEARLRRNGQAVYSTGAQNTPSRFAGHLITNILGALATSALLLVVHSTAGFDAFVAQFSSDAAFNVLLPLSSVVAFAFVRWQQVDACPDLDERARRRDPNREAGIDGFSLRHAHQFLNLLYLITVSFVAATTVVYLFSYAITEAKAGRPLTFSWQVLSILVLSLSFLYACGAPRVREQQAVYLTFLTGTPAALGAAAVWLALFRDSTSRDVAALTILTVGYVLYCAEVVLASRRHGEKLHLHYFSAAGVVLILVVLLGALYLS